MTAEFGDRGEPDFLSSPEFEGEPEALRNERGLYAVSARHIIEDINSIEVRTDEDFSDLKESVSDAAAFSEGLSFGRRLSPEELRGQILVDVQNKFTTVESSIDRRESRNLDETVAEALMGPVGEYKKYESDRDRWMRNERRKLARSVKSERKQMELMGRDASALPSVDVEVNRLLDAKRGEIERIGQRKEEMVGLYEHYKARKLIDTAFKQRQMTAESQDNAASMEKAGVGKPVTPDKGHWKALFQADPEFGRKVDRAMRNMVNVAHGKIDGVLEVKSEDGEKSKDVSHEIFSRGFDTTGEFKALMEKVMLPAADNNFDAAWLAWRASLLMEVPTMYSARVDDGFEKSNDKGKYKFGTPPIASSLISWTAFLNEHRAQEYGWNDEGERINNYRAINKSGHPLSIGKTEDLQKSFLHQQGVKFDKSMFEGGSTAISNMERNMLQRIGDLNASDSITKKQKSELEKKLDKLRDARKKVSRGEDASLDVSLFDLWYYGEVSFADPDFPWAETEEEGVRATSGEIGSGAFGVWMVNRGRANGVIEDIRSIPRLSDLGSIELFENKRNWDKLKIGTKKDLAPEENPRNYVLAGWMMRYVPGSRINRKVSNDDRDYNSVVANDYLEYKSEGSASARKPTPKDIVGNAIRAGFIRKVDGPFVLKLVGE